MKPNSNPMATASSEVKSTTDVILQALDGLDTSRVENLDNEINVLSQSCPSRQVLDLIADKWTVLVIYLLSDGIKRFGELQRMVDGISKKMLTQTLRNLERNGLVKRKVYAVVPPKVEYSLTVLGQSLYETTRVLCRWAEDNLSTVLQSQVEYDTSQEQDQ